MRARSSQKPDALENADANRLRADALHNRNHILDIARHLFATRGIDVPMATIARHAGVGVATLYRRFPTRNSLVIEVFADKFKACASIVDDALVDPEPWRGFCGFIEKLCAMQAADKGFTAAFLVAFPNAIDYESEQMRAEQRFTELVHRAKEAGSLRPDFDQADLVLLLLANNGIIAASADAAPAASRRFVAYMLQSFQACHAQLNHPLPQPPPLDLRHLHP